MVVCGKEEFSLIEVEHLTKKYGEVTAVSDLSFTIMPGEIYGFLGPNGAGKSTTMNIMTGCLSATEGHVRIDGHDIFEEPNEAKRLIGYLPEQPPLYVHETPLEYLRFVGEAKGLRSEALTEQIGEVVRQTGIESVKNRRIADLSKGYKQRVGIAQALLGNPQMIILDEPTVGLDPLQIIEIRDLIKELGKSHTVLFSSHILSEVQTVCGKILILAKGKLVAFDTPENLERRMTSNEIVLTADAPLDGVTEILTGVEDTVPLELQEKKPGMTEAHIRVDTGDVYDISRRLFFAFAERNIALLEIGLKRANLEDIFIELTEKEAQTDDSGTQA